MRQERTLKEIRGLTVRLSTFTGIILAGAIIFFLSVCPVLAQDPLPKDVTALVEDPSDNSPLGNRTPLILVHGHHGNEDNSLNSPNYGYFSTFREFFYTNDTSGLKNKFKVYYFFYLSDQIKVDKIADGFIAWVDERTLQDAGTLHSLKDVPFVILAHSMGGLVSRSFMNKTLSAGHYSAKMAGERVIKLITLATPHHGTQGANGGTGVCKDGLCICLGCLCAETQLLWREPLTYLYEILGEIVSWKLLPTGSPNRSDLLWDNFNGSMSGCSEVNTLLPLSSDYYDYKIVAYGATLSSAEPDRPNDPANFVNLWLKGGYNDRTKLRFASVLLYEAMQTPSEYGENDGLVPAKSSVFQGHAIDNSRTLDGFDHGEMKGDALAPGTSKYNLLLIPLGEDLNNSTLPDIQSVSVGGVPATNGSVITRDRTQNNEIYALGNNKQSLYRLEIIIDGTLVAYQGSFTPAEIRSVNYVWATGTVSTGTHNVEINAYGPRGGRTASVAFTVMLRDTPTGLTVTAPNGGENSQIGSDQNIKWK